MLKDVTCISFVNPKGGTGKTTSCVSIGVYLAKDGKKALVVDFDPRANATMASGIDPGAVKKCIYDVVLSYCGYGGTPITPVILDTNVPNLHIAPSEPDLSIAEVLMQKRGKKSFILKRILEDVKVHVINDRRKEEKMTRILVVDDEPLCIELISGLLPKEYEVETAADGKEALIKVKETSTDLILLDEVMPEIDGYEVCRRLKGDAKTVCIPVVMVTSLSEKEDWIKAIEAGADDFLTKPIDVVELNARVKSLLRIKHYHDELVEEKEMLRVLHERLEDRVKERTASLVAEVEMRKKAEENLRNTLKELARSNAELEQIVYIASRDLQQPLQVISSNLGLLGRIFKGKPLEKDAYELVENAVNGSVGMQRRINDLFTYSRMGTRKEPEDTELIFNEAVTNLGVVIKKTGAEITHDKLPVVLCDHAQFYHLFHHLLDNAIKFRNVRPSQVHISAREEGDNWIFSVEDNGVGIDPKYLDSLFFISEHVREGQLKTGIGLAICKKIVERHGGRIWVESKKGEGSTFRFAIPKK